MASRRGLVSVSIAAFASIAAMETALATGVSGLTAGHLPEDFEYNRQEITGGDAIDSILIREAVVVERDFQNLAGATFKCIDTSGRASLAALDAAIDAVIVAQEGLSPSKSLRAMKVVRTKIAGSPTDVVVMLFTSGTPKPIVQKGTATLVGGTVDVASIVLRSGQVIHLTRNTPGGTIGDLSAPQASRTGTQFTINSDNVLDTSTVDWSIVG